MTCTFLPLSQAPQHLCDASALRPPRPARRESPPVGHAAREHMDGEVQSACALNRTFCRRDRLGAELQRLERLQQLALLWPRRWRRCIANCREPLSLWLYGVALGVAGLGQPEAAVALLDALPGVSAGAAGRRDLLLALLADATSGAAAANDAPALGAARSDALPRVAAQGGGR